MSLQTLAAHSDPASAPTVASVDCSDLQELLRSAQACYQSDRYEDARGLCRLVLDRSAEHPDGLHLMGLICHAVNEFDQAAEFIEKAIGREPNNPYYHNHLGAVYSALRRRPQTAACFRRALELKPDFVEALINLSSALRATGEFTAAEAAAGRAVDIAPHQPEAHFSLALAFHAQGLLNKVADTYSRVIALSPQHSAAHFNLGIARMDQGRVMEASDHYRRALELKPAYPEALNGLSNALRILGRWDEALAFARKALEVKPEFPEALSHLAVLLRSVCDWDSLPPVETRLKLPARTHRGPDSQIAMQPLYSLWSDTDPATRLVVAQSCSRQIAGGVNSGGARFSFDDRRKSHDAIRIGYLSSDFRNHPVGQQVLGLLRSHDRRRFRVQVYAHGPSDGSSLHKAIVEAADRFVDLNGMSDAAAAATVFHDGVDLLVDLNGHTAGNRLDICAWRPAPIQVSYLGFPGTTGAEFFDYLITDPIVTPPEHQPFYSERFVYLPNCYMVTDDAQPISEQHYTRAQFGLSDDQFVFCSFNSFFKIEPLMFSAWMSILRPVSGAVLWLPGGNPTAARNLRNTAERMGIDPQRLIFAEKLPSKADHLARLALADLALDTRIYNGHVSTCDALWAGVPVLTLQGSQFASRASASMLASLELSDLIVDSIAEYETTAVRLAHEQPRLRRIREKLAQNRTMAPLFQTRRTVANIESGYETMWAIFLEGGEPRQIEVK
jgi:protein O-GlcNAc transferase